MKQFSTESSTRRIATRSRQFNLSLVPRHLSLALSDFTKETYFTTLWLCVCTQPTPIYERF
jgi:hypothetical protein